MAGDLGVGPGVLKQGAKDMVEVLKPVEKVDMGDPAELASKLGNDDAAAALVTFCATWESGAEFLADCAAGLASGLDKANGDYEDTDEAIRDAVKNVKTALA
ncbi:hypothetical protein OKJ48_09335 [Streptomyces kunmingensis]|uniref:Excreted virulence factor EspC, type VII ESX diderm n=1 Tax=Streptomyces kunmingensis TaxID=68225 RepID=A0ABU6C763_9ACTN|nr:hypothetical protein [Streptomyces kunmingensis]MEB3960447.1 hypothetical protein [Streptomyces kunmingensis]